MTEKRIRNIAKIPVMVNGKRLKPDQTMDVILTEGIESRVRQGFLSVESIPKKKLVKEKPKKEVEETSEVNLND